MPQIRSSFVQVHLARPTAQGGFEYLALQRSETVQVYPGIWQVITGRIEEGETAHATAERETLEETGCSAPLRILPYVASFYQDRSDTIEMIPVFYAVLPAEVEVRLSSEHIRFEWLTSAQILARLPIYSHRMAHATLAELLTQRNP